MTIKRNAVPKSTLRQKSQLMSGSEIERTLVRLAHEILEKNGGVEGLGLVGIRRRGVPIAERLGKMIHQVEKKKVPVGTLDITFYRDDLSTLGPKPVVQETEIGFSIEAKRSSWWTTCSTPAEPRAPHWTLYFRMAVQAWCNCSCSSTAAIASCQSKPRSSVETCRRAIAK